MERIGVDEMTRKEEKQPIIQKEQAYYVLKVRGDKVSHGKNGS